MVVTTAPDGIHGIADDFADLLRERYCANPFEVSDGVYVRCRSRLVMKCASCATLNQSDWRAIARSGVYDEPGAPVRGYQFALLTLTAPSFGQVDGQGAALNTGSYDYHGQVRWHQAMSRLWNSSVARMRRIAPALEFFAVREWQRRGALHTHVIVRWPEDDVATAGQLGRAAALVTAAHPVTGEVVAWGQVWDARPIQPDAYPEHPDVTLASDSQSPARVIWYVAKALGYSLKSVGQAYAADSSILDHHLRLEAAARAIACSQCPGERSRACSGRDHAAAKITDWTECPRCVLGRSAPAGDCQGASHQQAGATSQMVTASRRTNDRPGWSFTGLTRRGQRETRKKWMATRDNAFMPTGLDGFALDAAEFLRAKRMSESIAYRSRPRSPGDHRSPASPDARSAALSSISWQLAPFRKPSDWTESASEYLRHTERLPY